MTILKAERISIGYTSKKKQKAIAQELSFSLHKGKLIALVGINGIGKSTLIKTICGIIPPLSGNILLNGHNLQEFSANELAQQLSVVLTEKLPPSNLTVFELIALGRQPYTNWLGKLTSDDYEIIKNALRLTQTTVLSEKSIFEISDGQLQKVLIARAIAQDTPFIVLDEPSTHLDLYHKVQLFKLLKSLSQTTQKCILFSTHDLDLALQLSDEIMVLTPDAFYCNTPDNLVKQHVFDHFFKDDTIVFDPEMRKFTIL